MKVTVTSNILNVYLNAGLIYGSENLQDIFSSVFGIDVSWGAQLWGWTHFPQMGIKGAAVATVIASLWMVVHYCFYLFNSRVRKKYKVFQFSLDKRMIKKQLQLALPMKPAFLPRDFSSTETP